MKVVGNIIENVSYIIMCLRYMDEREKNIQKHTGENARFCEDLFIETPIEF